MIKYTYRIDHYTQIGDKSLNLKIKRWHRDVPLTYVLFRVVMFVHFNYLCVYS